MSFHNLQTDRDSDVPVYAPRSAADMVHISGGTFRMGSDHHYPEEAPAHRVTVAPFWIDRTPVTNQQFRKFAAETGYVTFTEIPPDPKDYPGALPHMLYAGSLVFSPPSRQVDLRDWSQWWTFFKGADWRHPYGPKSNINGLDDHRQRRRQITAANPRHSNRELRRRKVMKVVLVAMALSATFVTSGASAQGINLSGPWQCVALCPGPPGGFAYITQYGWNLNLVNEVGMPSRAWIDYPGHIWVDRSNEGAIYSADGFTLQFDRGTIWQRAP